MGVGEEHENVRDFRKEECLIACGKFVIVRGLTQREPPCFYVDAIGGQLIHKRPISNSLFFI